MLLEVKLSTTTRALCFGSRGASATDFSGHGGATSTHRFSLTGGGVSGGLMLDLGVNLGAHQDDNDREPHPDHKADDSPKRTVGGVVGSEIRDVPRQQQRAGNPNRPGNGAAPGNPAPSGMRSAWPVTVETGEGEKDH